LPGRPRLPIVDAVPRMSNVRIGIIGLGNIGRHHANYLGEGRARRCTLAAVCSSSEEKRAPHRARGVAAFDTPDALFRSGVIDAVLIATPHYQHLEFGLRALEAGLHVMVEKPLAAHKADAERLLAAAAARPKQVLAGMFQLRVEPRYQRIRRLLASGELGQLQRITWINTDWFRSEAYYASGGWRATWGGEGGGVLLNQCLHNLDILGWLFGRPSRVTGFAKLGRWHDIEVEDDVTAVLEYPNGATGHFVSSTGELPGSNRLEIAGTRGRVTLGERGLTMIRNEVDAAEWSRTTTGGFTKPDVWKCELPFENNPAPHAAIMQNFADAILDGAPLIAPGSDAVLSVELANAIVYSAMLGRGVELPLDGAAWEAKLGELSAASTRTKKAAKVATDDFAASFRR
jgi:predicted dehydrogenase